MNFLPNLMVQIFSKFNAGQIILFASLALVTVVYFASWWRHRASILASKPAPLVDYVVGFAVAVGDTLGIGSFAPTTAIIKLRGNVADEDIPGTLNVGLTLAALLEAVIFITSVLVDPLLLVCMIFSAAAGAWFGAGVVGRMPRRSIQLAMGTALLIACTVFTAINLHLLPGGGVAMALSGWKFALAVALNFIFGALMSVGIGLYAPCMIMLALMGMHPLATFPIMGGACAILQPVAAIQFFNNRRFSWPAVIGLTIGSIPGVLIAAFVIKSLDMTYLRWLVILVVFYAATSMLLSARQETLAVASA